MYNITWVVILIKIIIIIIGAYIGRRSIISILKKHIGKIRYIIYNICNNTHIRNIITIINRRIEYILMKK